MSETPLVEIYTDGACTRQSRPRRLGRDPALHRARAGNCRGGEPATTNNRMELMAAISALEALKRPCKVRLSHRQQIRLDGITKWIHGWKKNGWKTADKKPVKNGELWQASTPRARRTGRLDWVKGHAGHPENERADELAREAIATLRAA